MMNVPPRYLPAIARGQQAAARADWPAVARVMGELLERALQDGLGSLAAEAAGAEADALWRDERPSQAATALRRALDLTTDDHIATVHEIRLMGVLLDVGRLAVAAELGWARLAASPSGRARALAVDVLCGVVLARGDISALEGLVAELEVEANGAGDDDPLGLAVSFRLAQLDRSRGRLNEAAEGFGVAAAKSGALPAALGARAAALSGLAGVALLRGQPRAALGLFAEARSSWAAVGRHGGAFRAAAGQVGAQLALGADAVYPGDLDQGVTYARERHLLLLEIELLLARGVARAAHQDTARARQDLERAVLLAEGAGARPLAGRAGLALHAAGGAVDLERVIEVLQRDVPWGARALLAHAEATGDTAAAGAALCRFEAMDMEIDADRARGLVGTLMA